ncbi:MAG: hypothetical protein H0X37_26630 [Herpetosiphonaceae bacterium]|nr:hypothetical protein [Herpetosiphonaceae bacterium]
MTIDILRWWLVLQVLGLVGLPFSLWLFRRLPDHGISFSKPLGILLTAYGAWILTSIGLGSFGYGLIVFMALVVAGSGLWACRSARLEVRALLRAHVAWWAWQEGLLIGALLLGLVLRWHSPYGVGINHTETNMDFMFLNGILASQAFPPHDPWLAGYPINYYYFGYLLIALLTRLSALPSAITFTLALPTIFALTANGVAGIVWNAIGLRSNLTPSTVATVAEASAAPAHVQRLAERPWRRLLCATLAAVFVLLLANQSAAMMYLTGMEQVMALDGSELTSALRQSLAGQKTITFNPPTAQTNDPSDWGHLSQVQRRPGKQLGDFFWWPSRSVWDTRRDANGQAFRQYTITEFPLFSFILGDMHPHVLSLPWTLLAMALALNLLARRTAPDFLQARGGRLELLLTGIILGSLYAINSWDLPTYLLLYLLALGLLYAWLALQPGRIFWPHCIMQAGAVAMAAYILWLPFYLSFTSLVSGKGFPLGLAPARTALHAFVVVFGVFFVPLLAILLQGVLRPLRAAVRVPRQQPVRFGLINQLPSAPVSISWPLITAVALLVGVIFGWPLLWLLPLAAWAMVAAYHSENRSRSAALLLLALGAMVVWGTDLVYIRDVFDSRMNTIFKFFYQVWLVWGTASGIALWFLLRRVRARTLVWAVPFGVLLLGSSFYLFLAPNWHPVEATLNGLAYLDFDRAAEVKAMNWIRGNTASDAVILEAPGDGYNSPFGAVSMSTGRPTVIAWLGHEQQWRGGQADVYSQLAVRQQETTKIFTTPDRAVAQPLLDKYHVDYVYVGRNERDFAATNNAPPATLTKFGDFMQKVYDADGVTIYKKK